MKKKDTDLIKDILEISMRKICKLYNFNFDYKNFEDLINNKILINNINNKILQNNIFRTRKFSSVFQFYVYRNLVYFLIRQIKPKIIVETGVFHGLTSAWILQALTDNNYGKLISIDLPRREWDKYMGSRPFGPGAENEEEELGNEEPGWLIPSSLKKRWELVLGPSEIQLEKVCKNLDNIDLFIHDSDHSYQTMKFECDYIIKNYPEANIIIDDFNVNNYTYELLSLGNHEAILMDEVDPKSNVFPSSAFLKKKI